MTGVSFTPYVADLNVVEHNESKKSRHGNWEQTPVSRWKDSPDPLPDTDVVIHPDRIDKFETVTPGRGFVGVIADSVRTMEQYGGVSIEIGEGLATRIIRITPCVFDEIHTGALFRVFHRGPHLVGHR